MQKLQIYENLKVFGTKDLYYFFVQFNKTDFLKIKRPLLMNGRFTDIIIKKIFQLF